MTRTHNDSTDTDAMNLSQRLYQLRKMVIINKYAKNTFSDNSLILDDVVLNAVVSRLMFPNTGSTM